MPEEEKYVPGEADFPWMTAPSPQERFLVPHVWSTAAQAFDANTLNSNVARASLEAYKAFSAEVDLPKVEKQLTSRSQQRLYDIDSEILSIRLEAGKSSGVLTSFEKTRLGELRRERKELQGYLDWKRTNPELDLDGLLAELPVIPMSARVMPEAFGNIGTATLAYEPSGVSGFWKFGLTEPDMAVFKDNHFPFWLSRHLTSVDSLLTFNRPGEGNERGDIHLRPVLAVDSIFNIGNRPGRPPYAILAAGMGLDDMGIADGPHIYVAQQAEGAPSALLPGKMESFRFSSFYKVGWEAATTDWRVLNYPVRPATSASQARPLVISASGGSPRIFEFALVFKDTMPNDLSEVIRSSAILTAAKPAGFEATDPKSYIRKHMETYILPGIIKAHERMKEQVIAILLGMPSQ